MPGTNKTVTTTATLLAAAKGPRARQWIRIELRLSQSADVYIGIGDPDVTVETGQLLRRGCARMIENSGLARPASKAIYGIVASGSVSVLVDENT